MTLQTVGPPPPPPSQPLRLCTHGATSPAAFGGFCNSIVGIVPQQADVRAWCLAHVRYSPANATESSHIGQAPAVRRLDVCVTIGVCCAPRIGGDGQCDMRARRNAHVRPVHQRIHRRCKYDSADDQDVSILRQQRFVSDNRCPQNLLLCCHSRLHVVRHL